MSERIGTARRVLVVAWWWILAHAVAEEMAAHFPSWRSQLFETAGAIQFCVLVTMFGWLRRSIWADASIPTTSPGDKGHP